MSKPEPTYPKPGRAQILVPNCGHSPNPRTPTPKHQALITNQRLPEGFGVGVRGFVVGSLGFRLGLEVWGLGLEVIAQTIELHYPIPHSSYPSPKSSYPNAGRAQIIVRGCSHSPKVPSLMYMSATNYSPTACRRKCSK